MGIKKVVLNTMALKPTSQGFTGAEARKWVRKEYRHKHRDFGYSKEETQWAIDHGFMPEQVEALGITEENVKDYISAKDYAFLKPLNGTYRKWISDKITIYNIFKPFRKNMPEMYYQIGKRLNEKFIIPLGPDVNGTEFEDILALIREKGAVSIEPVVGSSETTLRYADGKYYADDLEIPESVLLRTLRKFKNVMIVKEKITPDNCLNNGVINLIVFNEMGDNPVIGDGFITFGTYQAKNIAKFRKAVARHGRRMARMAQNRAVRYAAFQVICRKYPEQTGKLSEVEAIKSALYIPQETFNVMLQTPIPADEVEEILRDAVMKAGDREFGAVMTSEYEDVLAALARGEEFPGEIVDEEYEGNLDEVIKFELAEERAGEEKDDADEAASEEGDESDEDDDSAEADEAVAAIDRVLQNENTVAFDVEKGMWGDIAVPYWDEIVKTVKDVCVFVPQLEFFGAQIVITADGFKITKFVNYPKYPTCKPFSKETSAYLMRKVEQKKEAYADAKVRRERRSNKVKLKARSQFAKSFFPKGLKPYLSLRWMGDVWKDFRTCKDTSLSEKMWAYKHGFLSYRLVQYGITEDNWEEYISDFEYKWLRHINPYYRKWMEDKITVKYICSDYNQFFPEYYFHIICKNGNNKVISMMDLPEGYTNTFEEIFRLVEEKGVLALKPDEGSHGDGFYKFTCEDGKYQLNYQDVTKEDVLKILEDVNNQYLVTEYINMCDELKAVYDGAVNTVRMIVFKKDGREPQIGNAYVRFGSKKTGAVDNVGAGGMTATIDVATGHFHDAKIVRENSIEDCPIHPDTGVPIDGYLPHWEQVKKDVLDVTRSIKQLEWFGVDLAVTNDGIKFPEINRFPDFPAVEKYTDETREYLLDRLNHKKKLFRYDGDRNKTLVHLPKRPDPVEEIPAEAEENTAEN